VLFDQHLSMKVVLLLVAAFAIVAWAVFTARTERPFDVNDLGPIDMNDARRQDLINQEAHRWE
jgi:hypothetical protein